MGFRVATMNENKEGKRSTDILIPLSLSLVDYIRVYFSFTIWTNRRYHKSHRKECMPNHPNSYGQICRRLSTLDIDVVVVVVDGRIDDDDDGDNIVIAIDSTGIKVANRGQWIIRDKWNIRKKG